MSAFEYQLKRSVRRKTLSIVVSRGQVKVMAPVFVPSHQITQFVRSKTPWILEKLQQQQGWADELQQGKKQFVSGEHFNYLGEPLELDVFYDSKSSVIRSHGKLLVSISTRIKRENRPSQVQKLLKDWYKRELARLLDERVAYYADQIGVSPTEVIVRSYSRRWGSCSSKGVVSFNYLLMMTPLWVIDYVVIHELCHLVHLNHSGAFWQLVQQHYAEPNLAKQYLKQHAAVLVL